MTCSTLEVSALLLLLKQPDAFHCLNGFCLVYMPYVKGDIMCDFLLFKYFYPSSMCVQRD